MQHRAAWSHEGGTWAVPGGALDVGESPLQAALREAGEEAAVPSESVRPRHAWTVDHGTWAYTTVVAESVGTIVERRLDNESQELRWVRMREVASLPLHSGFAAAWPHVHPLLTRDELVVVDAANVVGSRPDGWWNDRVGAAQRLLEGIGARAPSGVSPADGLLDDVAGRSAGWPDWLVVLEGQARAAAAHPAASDAPASSRVDALAAPGSGDDAIVASAAEAVARGRDVTVVTADRVLRERVATVGARSVGPRALLALLDGGRP